MSRRELPVARSTVNVPNPSGAQLSAWRAAQALGMVGTVALLAGLWWQPAPTLRWFWSVVVPVLPLVFLVNPMIWRNVCPLATVNRLSADRWGRRLPSQRWATAAPVIGLVLLYLMVPARHFLFNTHGPALAITIAGVAVLPFLAGLVYEGKSGFCNAICPVLSVERLYGQRPFAEVDNARCAPCTRCTDRGCIDLSLEKAVAQTLGRTRRSRRWLLTPFGIFAASFPGFVFGYFTVPDGPLSTALDVYVHVLLWAAASAAVAVLTVWVWPQHNRRLLLALGAAAAGLYYWFVSPAIVETLGLASTATPFLRTLALLVVAVWLSRGWRLAWARAA